MKILVTGGAGYIGSHTVVELLGAGFETVIIDNLSNSNETALDKIEKITGKRPAFYEADIRDESVLDRIFSEHKIDAVIHFAALKSAPLSVSHPIEYYQNNLNGTLALCAAMNRHGCKRMVFSSSATVYGGENTPPFVETMPTSALNPYGWTKVMNEQILNDICVSDPEWSVLSLRYFNPIGAHESGLIGEEPSGVPSNIFPYLVRVASGKYDILPVTGTDYDTRDGTPLRDYIHVVDLAQGHLAALDFVGNNSGYDTVNLGTGMSTGVFEMIEAFERVNGVPVPHENAPRRPGDAPDAYAAVDKAKELLGWQAKLDLDRMCKDGWRFIVEAQG